MDTIKLRAVKRFDLDGQFITEKSPPFELPRPLALEHIALGNCIAAEGVSRDRVELPPPPVAFANKPRRRKRANA